MATVKSLRVKRELQLLSQDPPPGIAVWTKDDVGQGEGDNLTELAASICGPKDSPYETGVFKLDINIPDNYPFVPPVMRFATPIYHPNIDTEGRICLDLLKMPPKGNWKPCLNLSSLLISIQLLMTDPNPDDPLLLEVSEEFKNSRPIFDQKARDWTCKHAKPQNVSSSTTATDKNVTPRASSSMKRHSTSPTENQAKRPKLEV